MADIKLNPENSTVSLVWEDWPSLEGVSDIYWIPTCSTTSSKDKAAV